MRVPRLKARSQNRLLTSGLLLVALSTALGQFGSQHANDDSPALHSAQVKAQVTTAGGERCDREQSSA